MKVSINKITGLMIESASHSTDETMLANAIMLAGITAANVELRTVTEDEHKALIAARDAAQQI